MRASNANASIHSDCLCDRYVPHTSFSVGIMPPFCFLFSFCFTYGCMYVHASLLCTIGLGASLGFSKAGKLLECLPATK